VDIKDDLQEGISKATSKRGYQRRHPRGDIKGYIQKGVSKATSKRRQPVDNQ